MQDNKEHNNKKYAYCLLHKKYITKDKVLKKCLNSKVQRTPHDHIYKCKHLIMLER